MPGKNNIPTEPRLSKFMALFIVVFAMSFQCWLYIFHNDDCKLMNILSISSFFGGKMLLLDVPSLALLVKQLVSSMGLVVLWSVFAKSNSFSVLLIAFSMHMPSRRLSLAITPELVFNFTTASALLSVPEPFINEIASILLMIAIFSDILLNYAFQTEHPIRQAISNVPFKKCIPLLPFLLFNMFANTQQSCIQFAIFCLVCSLCLPSDLSAYNFWRIYRREQRSIAVECRLQPSSAYSLTMLGHQQHQKSNTNEAQVQEMDRVLELLRNGQLKTRDLESQTYPGDFTKAVQARRNNLCELVDNPHCLERIPYLNYDYKPVFGQCCEEVIGYVPIPLGKCGPLLLDRKQHYLPMATTEGCLIASTNRGLRAIFQAGGAASVVFRDQMTRAPVLEFPSIQLVVECIAWLESDAGFKRLKRAFDCTSSHIDLLSVLSNPAGRFLHVRFAARTGNAMGMNMISKATDMALRELMSEFPAVKVLALSGNMCTDKKPAAINSILGRGKSVLAEVRLPEAILAGTLKTSAARMAKLATAKNFTGSVLAGCGSAAGCNAHAANIVAGIFAATGQDIAQVVDSSACLTQLEHQLEANGSSYLLATVTMPCLEVGVIGGGTRLPVQQACLQLMDLEVEAPAEHFARLLAVCVLAGELSLLAALDSNDLVSAHLQLNRAGPVGNVCASNSATVVVQASAQTVSSNSSLASCRKQAGLTSVTKIGMHLKKQVSDVEKLTSSTESARRRGRFVSMSDLADSNQHPFM